MTAIRINSPYTMKFMSFRGSGEEILHEEQIVYYNRNNNISQPNKLNPYNVEGGSIFPSW